MKTVNKNSNCTCVCDCPEVSLTPAQEKGIFVGQGVYRYLGDPDHAFETGDLVVLVRDDESRCPEFQRLDQYQAGTQARMTFAYVWEVEEVYPPVNKPVVERECTCQCTCSPAKLKSYLTGVTIFEVVSDHMPDYIKKGELAVMVYDDGTECPRFQRLQNYLNGEKDISSTIHHVCYLGLDHVVAKGELG